MTQAITLTPRQIELARHALGLSYSRQSYRNYFCAGVGHVDHPDWMAMVDAGCAKRRASVKALGGDDLFTLTFAGARAALKPGETLDPECFPEAVRANGEQRKDSEQ